MRQTSRSSCKIQLGSQKEEKAQYQAPDSHYEQRTISARQLLSTTDIFPLNSIKINQGKIDLIRSMF